jgi:hypothetical protein
MSEQEQPQEDLTLTILANMMALNIFIKLKFGDEGAELLEEIETQVRETMKEDGVEP